MSANSTPTSMSWAPSGAISKQPMQKLGFLREGRIRSNRPTPPNGTRHRRQRGFAGSRRLNHRYRVIHPDSQVSKKYLSSRDLRRASVRGESQLKNHGTLTAIATNKTATIMTAVTHIPGHYDGPDRRARSPTRNVPMLLSRIQHAGAGAREWCFDRVAP